tara:strand:+ start:1465 stop:1590 length:126 start_codon:yes stop_codon:yes gene_type:complete
MNLLKDKIINSIATIKDCFSDKPKVYISEHNNSVADEVNYN